MTAWQPEWSDQFRFTASGQRVSELTFPGATSPPDPQDPDDTVEGGEESCG